MTRSDVMVRAAPWLYTAIMFIVWEAAVRLFKIPTFFLPPPTAIANAFVEYWTPIYRHSLYTLSTTMIGFGMAVGLGLLLGLVLGRGPPLSPRPPPPLNGIQTNPQRPGGP